MSDNSKNGTIVPLKLRVSYNSACLDRLTFLTAGDNFELWSIESIKCVRYVRTFGKFQSTGHPEIYDRNICTFLPAGNNFELWPLGIKSKHQMYAVNANVLASSNQRDIPLPDFYFAADSFMIER